MTSDETGVFFDKFLTAFDAWVATIRGGSDVPSFDGFMTRRAAIALDYVNGETQPLAAIVTQCDPATFFSPKGDHQSGAVAVAQRYLNDAKNFAKPGTSRLEILQSRASGGLAFWTGLQHAQVRLAGKDDPVPMTLRITEVFRQENGEWSLVHRHADMAKNDT